MESDAERGVGSSENDERTSSSLTIKGLNAGMDSIVAKAGTLPTLGSVATLVGFERRFKRALDATPFGCYPAMLLDVYEGTVGWSAQLCRWTAATGAQVPRAPNASVETMLRDRLRFSTGRAFARPSGLSKSPDGLANARPFLRTSIAGPAMSITRSLLVLGRLLARANQSAPSEGNGRQASSVDRPLRLPQAPAGCWPLACSYCILHAWGRGGAAPALCRLCALEIHHRRLFKFLARARTRACGKPRNLFWPSGNSQWVQHL